MIERFLEILVKNKLHTGKAIVLLGARQVGKTTLLKMLFGTSEEVLWMNGDELDVQAIFAAISATRLKAIFGKKITNSDGDYVVNGGSTNQNRANEIKIVSYKEIDEIQNKLV